MNPSKGGGLVRRVLAILAFVLTVVPRLQADVIYFYDGNVLIVEKAWVEGDEVKYQTRPFPRSGRCHHGINDIRLKLWHNSENKRQDARTLRTKPPPVLTDSS